MKKLGILIQRNTRLFFQDRGTFFTAMIAPLILLLLFITFLGNVYSDSFLSGIPKGITVPEELLSGFVGGWLLSSLLAVSCITVAFTANMIMVQDKVNGTYADVTIAPVKSWILSLSYYISTALITAIICLLATGIGFIYLKHVGWYLSASDILYVLTDVVLLVLFGTAFSSVICSVIQSQGGMTAVTTIISASYGFLCGAFMPIASFSDGIQKFIKYLPGTYGTALLHNHFMNGCFGEMNKMGIPAEVITPLKDAFDNNLYFQNELVSIQQMYIVLTITIVGLVILYLVINALKRTRK